MPALCSAPVDGSCAGPSQACAASGERTGQGLGPGSGQHVTRFMYTRGWPRAPPPPSHDITRLPTWLTGCSAIRSMAKFSFTWNKTDRSARRQVPTPNMLAEFQCRPPHRHAPRGQQRRSAPSHLDIYADLQNTDDHIHAHTCLTLHLHVMTHPLLTSCPTLFSSHTGARARTHTHRADHTHAHARTHTADHIDTHTHTRPPPPVFDPTATSTRGPGSELTAGLAPSRKWDTEPLAQAKGCSTGVPGA